jgi:alpha-D-ribose 1-methylphosphonate 5-triphosphate synthase subunit PhnH
MTPALSFADPVFESQAAFRAVLNAMASPGKIFACGEALSPPPPLCPAAAATLLALADFETPLFVAMDFPERDAIAEYLRFHTGAPFAATPDKAAFALELATSAGLDLARFAEGTPEYPDRSTTLVLQVQSFAKGPRLRLAGPGIKGEGEFAFSPSPKDFVLAMQANHEKFPLGVDLILAAGAWLAAAPRSTLISEAG